MVTLNKIYTKTGDQGTTALGNGERRPKSDTRIDAYGTIDETNALLGIVRLHTSKNSALADLDAVLLHIQNDLFDLGADLATPDMGEKLSYEPLRITKNQVHRLEKEIDKLNKNLSPLKSFILPGGSHAASYLHLARTVTRRAERLIIKTKECDKAPISEDCIKYVNRLSDFFFVASRHINSLENEDILWVPGQNR